MTDEDPAAAAERFLDDAATVYEEYDQGYMDADAALSILRTHVDELDTAVGEHADDE